MSLVSSAAQFEKFLADRSPEILTGIGVAGTVATALLTGKAAYRHAQIMSEEDPYMSLKEETKLVWTLYLPAVGTGVLTVTCIVMATRIGARRTAAMAAAYTLSEKAFSEYRDQVKTKLGKNKERAVRDDLAQEQVRRNPASEQHVIITGDGGVLCYDAHSGRWFRSTMESIKKAMNDLNYKVNNHWFASLADFYDLLGIPPTEYSHELGWNSDRLLDIEFSAVLDEEGKPAISINYRVQPIRGYHRVS